MVNPKKLKRKVLAYEKFRDITKSIQMVALSNIAELKENIANRFLAIAPFTSFFHVPLYKKCIDLECIIMPLNIDKNCCGPHNSEVFTSTKKIIEYLENNNNNYRFFTTSKKGKYYFLSHYPGCIIKHVEGLNKDIASFSIFSFSILAEKLMKIEADRYFIIFNRFINIFKQEGSCYEIGPFNEFANVIIDSAIYMQYVFHRVAIDNKDYLNYINDLYLFGVSLVLMDAFEENEYSSLGARIVAMDNAKKNATKLIDSLTLKYHKARQEYITTELIEIVSCANFM
jgi:F-type H+-transporting ATPase subunit gamma